MVTEGGDGVLGEPLPHLVVRLLPRQYLHPRDLLAVLGGGGVHDLAGRRPDVDPGAVAPHEGDDGLVGDVEDAVGAHGDLLRRHGGAA
jgi:hypothetical protein